MLERRENQDLLSGDHDINDMNKRLGESRDSSNKKSKFVGTLAAIRYTLWWLVYEELSKTSHWPRNGALVPPQKNRQP